MNNLNCSKKFLEKYGKVEEIKGDTWDDVILKFNERSDTKTFIDWLKYNYHQPKEKKSYEKI